MQAASEVRVEAAPMVSHILHESDDSSEQDPIDPAVSEALENGQDETSSEPKRGKRASAKTVRGITIEQLIPLFSLSLDKAARALGISATSLKKVRRRLFIDAWPYRKFREIDTQIENTKSNIATQASERQKRQQADHLNKLEQEREALVQQCLSNSHSRRMPAAAQPSPQFFAFDEQAVEAHERTKKARLDLDPSKLSRMEFQNWDAYAHGTFPTPENHSVAGMASYGSLTSSHPHEWVRYQMSGAQDGFSQPNSPTHLLSASLNTMSLQNPAMAAAAAAVAAGMPGYPPMMPSPTGSTVSSSAGHGREGDAIPASHRGQGIPPLPMGAFGHEAQYGASQTGYPSGPSAWPSAGPSSATIEAMHPLHNRPQQTMQRTSSAPDVLRYSGGQSAFGPRGGMSGHQQYSPYNAAAYDARYHGYNRGSPSGFSVYDQHQQHGYMPQTGPSFPRDAHFLNPQAWHRR